MSVRIFLIHRRYVYLAVAVLCLAGGLSIAAIWRHGASLGDYDFGGRVVVTTGGALSQSTDAVAVPASEEDTPVAHIDTEPADLDSELEEALVSARVEYDYEGSSLAAARLSRDYARSREIDFLREALKEAGARGETAEETQRFLLTLVSRIEAESSAESLIRASGFADAVVYVTDLGVEAVVSCEELDKRDVAVIGGILSRTTGAKLHEIRVREAAHAVKKDNPGVW
jgi:stage III sporulation protein AH